MSNIFKLWTKKKNPIEKRIEKIKRGDQIEREALISDYIPFIIKTITQITNHYIEVENNDEYSIGLEAFNEAIDKYDVAKGNFISYSKLIIRSRLIDYQRKETTKYSMVSTSQQEDTSPSLELPSDEDFTFQYDLKEQIKILEKSLQDLDILFSDLVEESPKHIDTRLNCIRVAKAIVCNTDLKESIYKKKMLPASKIMKQEKVSQKFLKRNRKFIIATVLILDSQMDLLKTYILDVERGQSNGI